MNPSTPQRPARQEERTEVTELSPQFDRDTYILTLIFLNDLPALKTNGVLLEDLNFLKPFPEVSIDARISPLALATYLGRYEIVAAMLETNKSLDLDLRTSDSGFTPLMMAAKSANYDILKLLLENGAEPNIPSAFSQTALFFCFARLEETENTYENHRLCFLMADLLLHHGADINWIIDKNRGYTLLMQYCAVKFEMEDYEVRSNLQIVKFLLERGASKTIVGCNGKTVPDIVKKQLKRAEESKNNRLEGRAKELIRMIETIEGRRKTFELNSLSVKKVQNQPSGLTPNSSPLRRQSSSNSKETTTETRKTSTFGKQL
eukprot:TRINITY_DN909_c0_g1_i1.p1 TRINITY_DN909_c0_g1~~TRINITY_DN909_c0_g1_i1.p1  ORF type:complete len:319 (-),score=70.56 TRINITY_DN909_c0_g1_i1:113-1069(-)